MTIAARNAAQTRFIRAESLSFLLVEISPVGSALDKLAVLLRNIHVLIVSLDSVLYALAIQARKRTDRAAPPRAFLAIVDERQQVVIENASTGRSNFCA